MRHVALYLRISQDRAGRAEGVEVQERLGRAYAARTWPGVPVVIYCDNDLSAADDDVVRPEYDRLRGAVRNGDIAHVWCVEQSRIQRLEVGWFVLAAELVTAGIGELHTDRDGIVRVSDDVAGIKAVLYAGEVRKLKRRVNDRLADNAAQGKAPGSLPFGYKHARDERGATTYEIVPEQAAVIRWAAEQVLAGWSMASVEGELRRRGVVGAHRVKVRDAGGSPVLDEDGKPLTRPGRITTGSVRSWLTGPTIAGKRVHRGVIVGDGNWEPILDEATWQACQSALRIEREVRRADGGTYKIGRAHRGFAGRKYVLTGGLMVCGVCGSAMCGSVKQVKGGAKRGGRDVAYFMCHPARGGRACVAIIAGPAERHVADVLFAELDKPEFLDAIAEDQHAPRRDQIVTELSALDGRRSELAAMWGAGVLGSDEWVAAKSGIGAAERALRAELEDKAPPVARLGIEQARGSWPLMTIGEQREFVRLFISRITITRAPRRGGGRPGFDPGRIHIKWRLPG